MSTRILSETVTTWLHTHRPAGFTRPIRAESSLRKIERPQVSVIVSDGPRPHPSLPVYQLILRGEYLAKDEDNPGDFSAALHDLAEELRAGFHDLRQSLAARGLLLRKMVRGTDVDEPLEETARRLDLAFTLWVQTDIPAGSI